MTTVVIKDKEFHFSSPLAKHRFMTLAEGKEVRLEIREKPTSEMRKYFEGCLVPAFFYFHPNSGWDTFADAREVLKYEFAGGRLIASTTGAAIRVIPSTADMGKRRFNELVEAVVEWCIENGMPADVLDSGEYLIWRDTNFTDEIYPPLKRLKESYDRAQASQNLELGQS